jgi:hypothetical protein
MQIDIVLAGKRAMGKSAMGKRAMSGRGGVSNGAVGFEQGTGKDGDSLPGTKSCHSKTGVFSFLI